MERILVTGAAGTVGSELTKRLLSQGKLVCSLDNSEDALFKLEQSLVKHKKNFRPFLGDIRDYERLISSTQGVDTIYHCAALKHVELGEYNTEEIVKTNINGTKNIIKAAIKNKVKKFILTSSDKAVNPSSTMGTSKLMGEKLTLSANNHVGDSPTKLSIVRFGNILNSNGSVLTIFKDLNRRGIPLTITDEKMTRYFLSKEEAIDLCLFCEKNMAGGEIFLSEMKAFKVIDLAKAIYGKDLKYTVTGIKVGEKLFEELVSEVEMERAVIFKNKIVILPSGRKSFTSSTIKDLEKYNDLEFLNKLPRSDSKHILKSLGEIYTFLPSISDAN
mgnify:FL=1